jgi:hypothetical protein
LFVLLHVLSPRLSGSFKTQASASSSTGTLQTQIVKVKTVTGNVKATYQTIGKFILAILYVLYIIVL